MRCADWELSSTLTVAKLYIPWSWSSKVSSLIYVMIQKKTSPGFECGKTPKVERVLGEFRESFEIVFKTPQGTVHSSLVLVLVLVLKSIVVRKGYTRSDRRRTSYLGYNIQPQVTTATSSIWSSELIHFETHSAWVMSNCVALNTRSYASTSVEGQLLVCAQNCQ
jgi:hypothetical protein